LNELVAAEGYQNIEKEIRVRDLDGKLLCFRNDNRPRARYLYWIFYIAMLRLAWKMENRDKPTVVFKGQLGKGMWDGTTIIGGRTMKDFDISRVVEVVDTARMITKHCLENMIREKIQRDLAVPSAVAEKANAAGSNRATMGHDSYFRVPARPISPVTEQHLLLSQFKWVSTISFMVILPGVKSTSIRLSWLQVNQITSFITKSEHSKALFYFHSEPA
jgi:hypothetical protein